MGGGGLSLKLRRARQAVFAVFFLNGFIFANWVARIPAVQDELGLSEGKLGLALLGVAMGSLVAMPAAGWAAGRYGSKPVTLLTLLASCVAIPFPVLAPNLVTLWLALVALGAAYGAMDVAMNVQGVEIEEGYGRPILVSFHAAYSVGGLAGAGVGGVLAGLGLDPPIHLLIIAGVAFLLGVLLAAWLLPSPPHPREHAAREGGSRWQFLRHVPRRLYILGIVAFCCMLGEGAMADWSAVYLDKWLDTGPGLAAAGFAAFSLTMAAGRLIGDRLTTKWGAAAVIQRGGALVAVGLGLALLIDQPIAAIVGCGAVGAGLSATVPVVYGAAGRTPGMAAGPALAVASTLGYSGFLVGPPLIGLTAEVIGLPSALVIVAVMGAIIAVLAGWARESAADTAEA